jgi:hypothetical protein
VEKILPDDLYWSYDHVEKIYPRTISIRVRRSHWRNDVEKIILSCDQRVGVFQFLFGIQFALRDLEASLSLSERVRTIALESTPSIESSAILP